VPSIGWCVLIAIGAERIHHRLVGDTCLLLPSPPPSPQHRRRRRYRNNVNVALLLLILGGVTTAAFTAKTVSRNLAWASRPALFRSGLQSARSNAKVFYNYANYERDMGNGPVARLCYKVRVEEELIVKQTEKENVYCKISSKVLCCFCKV
jgi:predicted ribosomally synthesized peptide with SipW-like signal peptide